MKLTSWVIEQAAKATRAELENLRDTVMIQAREIVDLKSNNRELLARIKQLSPEKQFEVLELSFGLRWQLKILSVQSSNGKTIITAERAETRE